MGPLLLGLAALFGFGIGAEIRHFEHDAAADIRTKLGGDKAVVRLRTVPEPPFGLLTAHIRRGTIEAEHFTTSGLPLYTEPLRPQNGYLGELRLDLRDFKIGGLRAFRLEASIPDCRFDAGLARREHKIRLSKSGVGTGSVELLQQDLQDFVLYKFHEIKNATLTLKEGWIIVKGYGEFLFFQSDFEVWARLKIIGPGQIALDDARIWANGTLVGFAGQEALIKALTPLIDLDRDLKLAGAIKLTHIEVHEGLLKASGDATIPVQPATRG